MTDIIPVGQSRPPKIHALTSLRFFAALYVVFYHCTWGLPPGGALARIISNGFVSVEFFFLLSGYILAIVYLRRGEPILKRNFLVARFARIYPLYILAVLADTPFAWLSRAEVRGITKADLHVAGLLLANVFMVQMWIPELKIINIPSWSLSIEAVFYVCFPLIGVWLWKLRARGMMLAILLFYIAGVAFNWWLNLWSEDHLRGWDLPTFMSVFALGILLARWEFLRAQEKPQVISGTTAWCVLISATVAFAAAIYASGWLTLMHFNMGILLTPVFAAVIWSLTSAKILPVRLLSAKWLVVLGEASYALYLLHVPMEHLFFKLHLAGSSTDYPLYLSCCIGLSLLSFYFVETPSRKWITKKFQIRNRETMEVASDAQ